MISKYTFATRERKKDKTYGRGLAATIVLLELKLWSPSEENLAEDDEDDDDEEDEDDEEDDEESLDEYTLEYEPSRSNRESDSLVRYDATDMFLFFLITHKV